METYPGDGLPLRALLLTENLGDSLTDIFVESRVMAHEALLQERIEREQRAQRRRCMYQPPPSGDASV